MRTLVPAETLVYLETNDLAAALQPIVDSKAFAEAAKSKPDFSAVRGVQMAVAVTGFETSEEKLTDEHSVGRVQPHFVAVADTHAWNYQAVAFAEKKLGSFVTEIYDSEPTLDKSDKNGGKYFIWKAKDGRKAYALVIDSIIYFGNDETAIEKCLAVKRGEADSIAKAGKVQPAAPDTLASGYVGPDGIAQIANIVGLKFASEAADESEVQSAIAGILPQLIRNSITEISWTSRKNEAGIEDRYAIGMPADVANVFSETIAPIGENFVSKEFSGIPPNAISATVYNIKDKLVAWRSVLLMAARQTDPITGNIIGEFGNLLFEPYGVSDTEQFLKRLDNRIITARFDEEGEKVVLTGTLRTDLLIKGWSQRDTPITAFIKPNIPSLDENSNKIFLSSDGDIAASVSESIIIGDPSSVSTSIETWRAASSFSDVAAIFSKSFASSQAPIVTVGKDYETYPHIAMVMSQRKEVDSRPSSLFATETRFTKTGIDRRTISDFGLIGSIIAQLAQD